ncbi:endo alpha-1,4 polygalactosaminidase [Thermobifida cellulosilytica]|uniref:endo alpha-1,4 polygalactosaminidase n=1 Tax=Thermobifida cellulosilytica TaxID=144786 RepID=UPI0022B66780|nr:endo alpha-1,4 polygalactosaminidase [Thermobifida cellulosilytica]
MAAACTPAAGGGAAPAAAPPPVGARFDYQLGGAYDPGEGVAVVVRDSTAQPARGRYSVCYVNGFQTQPQERDRWLRDHPDLLLRDGSGEVLVDPAWPDEMLLDTSTPQRRTRVVEAVAGTVEECAAKGFDAVEFDNLDSYTRSGGALTAEDNAETARRYVDLAHGLGLAAAQKNTAELAEVGRTEIGFDFAIVEECARYAECAQYTRVYGDRVLDVEYADGPAPSFEEVCADADTPASTVLRDRELLPADAAGHVRDHC